MSLAETVVHRDLPDKFSMLEIGVGSYPFSADPTILASKFLGHRLNEPNPNFDFSGGRKYIGVDNGTAVGDHSYLGTPDELTVKAQQKLKETEAQMRERRPGENISFVFDDVFKLDLPSGSFHEVFMSNVLSSMIEVELVRDIVQLSARLLKTDGLLVTRETFTPRFMEVEMVSELMDDAGFTCVEAVSLGKQLDAYNSLAEYYGPTIHDTPVAGTNSGRYYCLAVR